MARPSSLATPERAPTQVRATPADRPSVASDGAVVERLARMRAACQALALELAGTRRELKVVEAELRRLKQRQVES